MTFRLPAAACLTVLLFLPSRLPAQEAAPMAFSYELGHAANTREGVSTTYSIRATQPLDSKLVSQKLQLERDGAGAGVTSHHTLIVNTGKYKTVSQMKAVITDILRRFASAQSTAGQELGKIGDVRYGGEIRFVAASADQLEYHVVTATGQDNVEHFNGADVQAFMGILMGAPRS